MEIKIGTKVWVRVQHARQPNTLDHALEQYRENVIVDETKTSWIVDLSKDRYTRWQKPTCKIDKKTMKPRTDVKLTFDLRTVKNEWEAHEYRAKHVSQMQIRMWSADICTLKKIAALLGYDDATD